MAGCIVTLGGMGSGIAWSSAYEPRGGLLRGGGGSLLGKTSFRLRRIGSGAGAVVDVSGPEGGLWWDCGGAACLLRLWEGRDGSVVGGSKDCGVVRQEEVGVGGSVGTGVGTRALAEGE